MIPLANHDSSILHYQWDSLGILVMPVLYIYRTRVLGLLKCQKDRKRTKEVSPADVDIHLTSIGHLVLPASSPPRPWRRP